MFTDCGGNEKFGKDNPDGKENLGLTGKTVRTIIHF
jgi:hypothetical protein